jgi:hypothetical protein
MKIATYIATETLHIIPSSHWSLSHWMPGKSAEAYFSETVPWKIFQDHRWLSESLCRTKITAAGFQRGLSFFLHIFGRLECVGHSFAYVAFGFWRDMYLD